MNDIAELEWEVDFITVMCACFNSCRSVFWPLKWRVR